MVRPFPLEGAAGATIGGATPIGAGGGTKGSFVGSFGAFASMAASSVAGGGRLGAIGLSGEWILSELPPTIAIGAGARDGESGAVPGLRLSDDVMLFVEGGTGWIGGGAPNGSGVAPRGGKPAGTSPIGIAGGIRLGDSGAVRCASRATPPAGLLGGGGAGAPSSR